MVEEADTEVEIVEVTEEGIQVEDDIEVEIQEVETQEVVIEVETQVEALEDDIEETLAEAQVEVLAQEVDIKEEDSLKAIHQYCFFCVIFYYKKYNTIFLWKIHS